MKQKSRRSIGRWRVAYGVVPPLAALDKYANILADWERYVNPFCGRAAAGERGHLVRLHRARPRCAAAWRSNWGNKCRRYSSLPERAATPWWRASFRNSVFRC